MPPEDNTTPAGGSPLPSDTISESSTPANEGTGNEFSGLGEYDDSVDLIEVPEVTPQPEVAPEQPSAPPVVEPAAPAPPKVAEPPQVTQQTAPPSPAAESGEQAPQRTLSEELTTHKAALIDALASERFALSPQEVEALEADAVAEMPRLLSKVYYETMTSVVNHIQNNVPQLVRHILEVTKLESSAEERFFGKFGTIDRAKHGPDVMNFARAFRQANPRVGEEELFTLVGAAVMAKHGLMPGATAPSRGNGVSPQPQPFVPARPGSSVKVTPEENPFGGLGRDFDD